MSTRKNPDLRLRDIGIMQPQCKASTKSGSQCKKKAVSGSTVCASHGGGAVQVREAGLRNVGEELKSRLSAAWEAVDAALTREKEEGSSTLAWKIISAQASMEAASSKPTEPEEVVLEQVPTWTDFDA